MSPQLKECEDQALQLSPQDRAILAEHLIASLDALDDSQTESLWLDEAERRYIDYKSGKIPARDAATVMRDARLTLK